jgi:hypothetical protein
VKSKKSDNRRGASGTRTLKAKKRTKIGWLIRKKNFVGERYDFVLVNVPLVRVDAKLLVRTRRLRF